jgi:hypothetical protein
MKKQLITGLSLLLLCGTTVMAQEADKSQYVSKKGTYIFPEKGEWAIGVYAPTTLLFQMNHAAQPISVFTGPNQTAFWGKKMLEDNKALRARVGLTTGKASVKFAVLKSDLTPDPNNPEFVEDVVTTRGFGSTLAIGIEKRRGKSRFQGIYGYEGILGYGSSIINTTYGNPIDMDFSAPETYQGPLASRPVELYTGRSFFMGARGFVGVEYFFSAKASLGGEFGYTAGFSTLGKGYSTNEYWNSDTMESTTITTPTNPQLIQSIGMGLDNFNAAINFFFYF